MKITGMKLEKRNLFEWMDPFEYMKRLSLPNTFALAAFEEQTDRADGKLAPAGLLIAAVEDDAISVEWLCVAPEHRFHGIGEALLVRCFEIAQSMKTESVFVRIALENEMRSGIKRIEKFLFSRLFEEERESVSEWRIDTKRVLAHKKIAKTKLGRIQAKPLRKVPAQVIKKAIEQFSGAENSLQLYDVRRYIASYDEDVSSVLMDGDDPCGLLLLKTSKDICCPVFFYAESEQEALALLACSAELLEKKNLAETEFYVSAEGSRMSDMMETLFPNERVSVRVMAADVEDFD